MQIKKKKIKKKNIINLDEELEQDELDEKPLEQDEVDEKPLKMDI